MVQQSKNISLSSTYCICRTNTSLNLGSWNGIFRLYNPNISPREKQLIIFVTATTAENSCNSWFAKFTSLRVIPININ